MMFRPESKQSQMTNRSGRTEWQRTVKDTASALKHLFDHQDSSLSDASFTLENDKCQPEIIHVHRLVLAARSTVFEAMFYGPAAEKKMPISVSDISAMDFRVMLRYLYKDDTTSINRENALQLLYASHKYDIQALKEHCDKLAAQDLSEDLVFVTIKQADLFNAAALTEACYKYIDANTTKAFSSPEFLEQPRKVVNAVLLRDTLGADGMPENCIFKALVRWAKSNAAQKATQDTGMAVQNVRAFLGKTLYLIRFPLMTPADIGDAHKEGILSADECRDLLMQRLEVQGVTTSFSQKARSPRRQNAPYGIHGGPLVMCDTCNGTGWQRVPRGAGHHVGFFNAVCGKCSGARQVPVGQVKCGMCDSKH